MTRLTIMPAHNSFAMHDTRTRLLDATSNHIDHIDETLVQKWKPLFDKFDVDGNGVISMEAFQVILYKYGLREDLDPHKREVLETTIEENTGGVISYQEFVNIMSDKRSLSFSIAVRSRYEECETDCIDGSSVSFKKDDYRNLTYQQRFLKMVADEILTNETDRNYFRCNFTWCLPPILIFLVTWIELGFYVGVTMNATRYDTNSTMRAADIWTGPLPKHSWLVFDPDKRIQFWRFFSYILLHGGIEHIIFNFSVQMLLGVPLEMVHGTRRIGTLYLISIAAGSMGTSVFDRRSYLVGASAGSYALLSAHLANVALHFTDSKLSPQRIAVVIVCVSADFGLAVYRRYSGLRTAASFVAHLMGVTIGLTIGLFILKNYEQRLHERLGMWLAMVVYIIFILFVVFWNIFYKPGPAV
ncbi:rhomboid-related protein 3 [Strongylocentrotus purpuratus]|uniref:EF-hand domain-containing protein n=2 Tax=Strongylocentrotus purpuratus TaxID=7668 RepID=A0A7M7HJG0_STRPU|nr:rhomboid-related protein 3 [Strongylocentrotus purpuratus]|eukprot:XP_011664721.1 PREDICTED: rhomboid-related protein 3 [Strongylocentrotus purpuratus]